MKKYFFLVLLLTICVAGFAQIKIGVKGGLNVASLKGTYPPNVSNKQKLGFHAGVTAEYPLGNPKFSLLGELLYSTQGNITNQSQGTLGSGTTFTYIDQESTISLTAIDFPIMLKYYVLDKLSIEGGPQFGYFISAKNKTDYTNSSDPSQNRTITTDPLKDGSYTLNGTTYNYKKTANVFDFGVNAGASYDISDALYLSLHYYFGLNTVQSEQGPIQSVPGTTTLYANTTDYKNSVFQVSLGYKFQ